jgi:hypothetical protein
VSGMPFAKAGLGSGCSGLGLGVQPSHSQCAVAAVRVCWLPHCCDSEIAAPVCRAGTALRIWLRCGADTAWDPRVSDLLGERKRWEWFPGRFRTLFRSRRAPMGSQHKMPMYCYRFFYCSLRRINPKII